MVVASFRRPNKMSIIARKNRTNERQVPDMVFIPDGRRRQYWMKSIEAGDTARPGPCAPVNDQVVVEHTRRWISSFVIGLGLCPFARRVFDAGRIRYAISHSRDENTLSNDLASELHLLLASPSTQIETTLLIHPQVLANFLDYNDFLGVVDQLLEELRLCGTIQVASFHPQYRFSGTEPNAAENYTNRSP